MSLVDSAVTALEQAEAACGLLPTLVRERRHSRVDVIPAGLLDQFYAEPQRCRDQCHHRRTAIRAGRQTADG